MRPAARKFCPRTGKITYPARDLAIKAMEAVKSRKPGPMMGTYVCEHCSGFHVGRTPERLR